MAVIGLCYHYYFFFFALFIVLLEFSYWCTNFIFNAGDNLSLLLFWTHISLGCKGIMHCIMFSCPLVYLYEFYPAPFWKGFKYLTPHMFISFIRFFCRWGFGFEIFSRSSLTHFSNCFLSSPLVCWCLILIFQRTFSFPFLQVFWFFPYLMLQFIPLLVVLFFVVCFFSLWVRHIFYAIYYSYIWTVYSPFNQGPQFFFIFSNIFISYMYISWLICFCDFVNFLALEHVLTR